ncbi:uncharacterized protein LOC131854544 [Achroia grisella]|uniref:uncharacterized protein LOC131854544 n=1 Tax=Achroia grisella TaxID=688607 RepID=UPI0027D2D981|nr:uncharacterized protein LOC131854544 [Achroia grisella]
MARVRSLDPRPMRCYRCLLTGHVGQRCTAKEDRGGVCFRCGQDGHKAASCTALRHTKVLCSGQEEGGPQDGQHQGVPSAKTGGESGGDGGRVRPVTSHHGPRGSRCGGVGCHLRRDEARSWRAWCPRAPLRSGAE